MRIDDEQHFTFTRTMRRTLTATVLLKQESDVSHKCVVDIHNPTEETFAFLYVPADMASGRFISLHDENGSPFYEVLDFGNGTFAVGHGSRSDYPFFKEWEVAWIPPLGVQQFLVPLRQVGKRFHAGEKREYWINGASLISVGFWYLGLQSEEVVLQIPLEAAAADVTRPRGSS